MKKNILLMVPMLDQGGLERVCAQTAVLLKDRHNVTVVVFNGENRIYDLADVELIDLHMGSKLGKLDKAINILKRVSVCKRIKKEKRIDITYSFGNTANIINVLSKVKDKVWIGVRGYGALAETKVMQFTCHRADKIICCTKVMADEIKESYPNKKVAVLYNPCDTANIVKQSKEDIIEQKEFFNGNDKIIAAMGRMHDVKGFWHIIKIFYLLQTRMPGTKLLFIGDKDSSEYEKLASDLCIGKKVLFLGVQKNPFAYLKYASAYLMTSETEGFPNALIEAMALGIPVMSVNCKTGPAEILLENYKNAKDIRKVYEGDYGVLLPIMNAKKNLDASVIEQEERLAAERLEKLLTDSIAFQKLSEAAKQRAECFTPSRYVEELEAEI